MQLLIRKIRKNNWKEENFYVIDNNSMLQKVKDKFNTNINVFKINYLMNVYFKKENAENINDIIMKICLCNTPEQKSTNDEEIGINKIVSIFGNDVYVKMYGSIYFKCKDDIVYIIYEDLIGNEVIEYDTGVRCNKMQNIPCERYLILEKGNKDLFERMVDMSNGSFKQYDINVTLDNFLDFFYTLVFKYFK